MIQATVLPAAGFNVDTIDSSSTCTTSTPNIPNEPLSLPAPTDGSDWVIRFGDGHHTTDAAAACLSTLATPDYYWEVSSKNISYNTCTTISPILGNRLAARAAVWMSGNADLTSIEMFYESSSEPILKLTSQYTSQKGISAARSAASVRCRLPVSSMASSSKSFMLYLIIVRLCLPIHAYTTFEPTCTTPEKEVNFGSAPDTRGTLTILWSCLFTIFACTWTVQHLNVPEQRCDRDPGIIGDIKWKLKGLWTSVKRMLVTMVAPEAIVGNAVGSLINVVRVTEKMERFTLEDGVP
ncbi:MAG: hypothetical protein MMC33_010381 [Icmadophila ericetorum]|nr:hypothetical protein [Icmadophila ericetorum]